MIGALFSLCLLAFIFVIFLSAFKASGGIAILQKIGGISWAALSALFFLLIVFVGFIESQDDFIYFWDNLNYWQQSVNQAQLLFHHPLQAVRSLYDSINEDAYNLLLPTLLAVPLKICGYTHAAYLCLNAVIWLVPTFVVLVCICKRIATLLCIERNIILVIPSAALAATFPAFYYALFNGFSDIAVLLPISLSLFTLIEWVPSEWNKSQFKKALLLSCLLTMIVLFRRHFAFYVVAFGFAMVFRALHSVFIEKGGKQAFVSALKYIGIVAGCALVFLEVFFTNFLYHSLFSNYAEAYVGYDAPLFKKVATTLNYFGNSIFFCLIFSLIGFIKYKNIRLIDYELIIIILVSSLLFFRIQSMGPHHVLNIAEPMFLLCFTGFAFLWRAIEKSSEKLSKYAAIACISLFIIIHCFNFLYAFASYKLTFLSFWSPVGPTQYTPAVRSDTEELHRLASYINEQDAYEGEKTVYILSSGITLNDSLMRNIDFPVTQNCIDGLQRTSNADMRDGFPTGFIDADIIVATDPIDLHLAEGTQETVRYLSEKIQDINSSIGKHYQEIATFNLQNNMKAKVYKKHSEYTESDLEDIRNYFREYYPGYEELFGNRITLN